MFLENYLVLTLHPKHYGKTDDWKFEIYKKRSENMNVEYQLDNEVGEMKITFATNLEGDPAVINKERWKYTRYQPVIHSMNQEKHWDQEKNQDQEKHRDQEKHWEQDKQGDQEKNQYQEKHQDQEKNQNQEKHQGQKENNQYQDNHQDQQQHQDKHQEQEKHWDQQAECESRPSKNITPGRA